ncbi:Trafficking particle complex subunit 6B [Micractinium conductrix]|uniref:Trafficking particle complex subunit 6B n=1 Tax=Micractinium conductrix TaxID=554055 RepID=A0A2P6V1V4_9CHLO|nr:Trafficking particle complex subunit 6B [Micractinium conductrix]|eukprot:PSC68076.1 Trafficking particle complex subunit 6B [Micractinium conductrix]
MQLQDHLPLQLHLHEPGLHSRPVMPARGAGRECAESCMDYLTLELVHHYRDAQQGPSLQAALDAVGERVGRQLAERYARDRPPLTEPLEAMKWLCKEFWGEVFRKPVDNLRTNHRGTFVLRDTQFRWLWRLAQNQMPPQLGLSLPPAVPKTELAADYLVLPCAIVRGALAQLGLDCSVAADAASLPQVDFTVVLAGGGTGGAGAAARGAR